jgi:hypothetical protein
MADLFPLEDDPRATLARVSRGLRTLGEQGLIQRYEANGKRYLFVTAWDNHQKIDHPSRGGKFPRPTCGDAEMDPSPDDASRDPRETLGLGAGEQGSGVPGDEEDSSSEAASAAPDTSPDDDEPPRQDVERLCQLLIELMKANGQRRLYNITKRWRNEARLLLDLDDVPLEEAENVLRWALQDGFWKSNIQSIPKFRDKFETLRLQRDEARRKLQQQGNIRPIKGRPIDLAPPENVTPPAFDPFAQRPGA